MTSPDGINWTSRTSAADNSWQEVTYGNGLFVAVASSGTGNRVMTSPDGINWTIRTSAADNLWTSVTYGNGLFVAVARLGTGNLVMTSSDGITWTSRTSAADNDWRSVAYGNGRFVAVSSSGTGNRVMTSGKTEQSALAHNNIYQGGMSILSGNVGIGTTTPSRTLTVAGTTYLGATTTVAGHILPGSDDLYDLGSTSLRFRDLYLGGETLHLGTSLTDEATFGYNTTSNVLNIGTDGTTNGDIAFFTDDFYLDKSTGNVGIGTTSPVAQLSILASGGTGLLLYNGNYNGQPIAQVRSGLTGNLVLDPANATAGVYINNAFATADTYINPNGGNVGIGTTTPSAKLHVTGTAGSSDIFAISSSTNSRLFTMTASGNVGIGTSTPQTTLSVAASSPVITVTNSNSYSALLLVHGTSNYVGLRASSGAPIYLQTDAGATTNIAALPGGNVGIGTTNPNQGKLEVKGGTVCVDTDSNDSATSCIASESDERLKENIETLNASSSLEILRALNPVSFDWRVNDPVVAAHYPLIQRFADNPHSIGLIAQEVELILPEALALETVGDDEVQYYQLDYTKFIPILVSAFQELDERTKMLAEVVAPLTEGSESLWDRLMMLANGFVDGVLTATGVQVEYVRSDYIESLKTQTETLCVGEICVTEEEFRSVFGSTDQNASAGNAEGSSQDAYADVNEEQDTEIADDAEVVDVDADGEDAADTDFDLGDSATSTDDETAADISENIASSAPLVLEEVATSSPSGL